MVGASPDGERTAHYGARRSQKLSSSKPTRSPQKSSPKVSATVKKGKPKKGKPKKKRKNALPPLDPSPAARRKRDVASKKRYAAPRRGPIKVVSGGLPGLGKR